MDTKFEITKKELAETITLARDEQQTAIVHEFLPLQVKAIREQVGMTQQEFATTFGISVGTLRHWERGDRKPKGPSLILLNVLAKEPQAVLRTLYS
jgi:putative transcriptional regulator